MPLVSTYFCSAMALSLDDARAAAREANAIFLLPENAETLDRYHKQCEGDSDIASFFQISIPCATNLLSSVIQKYGFEPSQSGCMQFTAELNKHASDPEIAHLEKQIKQRFVPTNFAKPPPRRCSGLGGEGSFDTSA